MSDPGRKTLPHFSSFESHNQSIIQYVTCIVAKRRALLGTSDVHELLLAVWRRADHWLIGRYVIMPDHVHFFCAPAVLPSTPLKRWMEFWRSRASKDWPRFEEKPIWQRDFFDRQLRSGESYSEKWHYILENPVRACLVATSADWPYQGELNVLPWHERV
jgi:REP element-mobilizing transposase RayT